MNATMSVQTGTTGSVALTVTDVDTAPVMGSGDVAVLATPRVVALVEAAAVAALEGRLADGTTSVGTRIEIEHLAPTPIGASVVAEATVTAATDRVVTFDVSVAEVPVAEMSVGKPRSMVARGSHTRVVVDRDDFVARSERR